MRLQALLLVLVLLVPVYAFAQKAATPPTTPETPSAPVAPTAPAAPTTPSNANSDTNEKRSFIPLTNIPALTDTGNSVNLEVFLNNFYKICIGLAAALAVLQIIRAGIMYMLGDSITEKKEARNLIAVSVFGLLLVLSPTIVFGLINKDILELNLDVKGLKLALPNGQTGMVSIPFTTAQECRDKGGTVSGGVTSPICMVPTDSDAAKERDACTNFEAGSATVAPASTGAECQKAAGESYEKVDSACCNTTVPEGHSCCAVRKAQPVGIDIEQVLTSWEYIDPVTGKESGVVYIFYSNYMKHRNACTAAGGQSVDEPSGEPRKCSEANKWVEGNKEYLCREFKTSCEL